MSIFLSSLSLCATTGNQIEKISYFPTNSGASEDSNSSQGIRQISTKIGKMTDLSKIGHVKRGPMKHIPTNRTIKPT